MRAYVFATKKEAEEFCTMGYPKPGVGLDGMPVPGKGTTVRAVDWLEDKASGLYYVPDCDALVGKDGFEPVEVDLDALRDWRGPSMAPFADAPSPK